MKGFLAAVVFACALSACGGAPPAPSEPPAPPLHLKPASDLAPAAGLTWLVDVRPRDLFADPQMAAAVRILFADSRFEQFAKRHGGIDLRQLEQLTVAAYPETTLFLANGLVDPARVEGAFAARARVDGRGIDRQGGALGTIVRTWGSVNGERQQLAIFGREAVGLEIGRFGPLRAAEFFAQEKLKKASPALRATPLDRAVAQVGANAPIAVFAPGPFTGEMAGALGGMFRGATAVAMSAKPAPPGSSSPDAARLAVRLALLGSFPDDGATATQRLAAALHVVSESALGRLCGLNAPIAGPTVRAEPEALVVDMTISAASLFRGLSAATSANVDEIMRH